VSCRLSRTDPLFGRLLRRKSNPYRSRPDSGVFPSGVNRESVRRRRNTVLTDAYIEDIMKDNWVNQGICNKIKDKITVR
jgi:hypothetical protein